MARFPQLWTGSFPSTARRIVSVFTVAVLSSCSLVSGPETSTPDNSSADLSSEDLSSEESSSEDLMSEDSLQVITTFLPMTYFTKAVAGDRATITQLLPTNVDPHDYQAKPQDIQNLADADVLIENGLGLESFLSDLIENAANTELVVVDSSEGIPTVAYETASETHSGTHGGTHSETHSETAHEQAGEEAHDHGESDPHLWLDPKKAIQQVENIRDGLIAADPEGETIYTANAADYIADLRALDAKVRKQLAPYAGKAFVTYHDFAGHFAHAYDLEVEHLVYIPEGNPTPADVQRVIDTVTAANLQVLLTEPSQQGNAFGAIASDLDIYISVFDSMESTGDQNPQPEDYLFTLSKNSDNLARAFGAPSNE